MATTQDFEVYCRYQKSSRFEHINSGVQALKLLGYHDLNCGPERHRALPIQFDHLLGIKSLQYSLLHTMPFANSGEFAHAFNPAGGTSCFRRKAFSSRVSAQARPIPIMRQGEASSGLVFDGTDGG